MRLRENRWSASLERLLRGAAPGGILCSAPLPPSAELTSEFLRKTTRAIPSPAFLAVREEGGSADQLGVFFPRLPFPRAATEKGLSAVSRLGELIGQALSLLGFNTNFAPLLDLATPFTEKKLGGRAFGADAKQVAQCGGAFIRGLGHHKILAVGKHFPGRGSVPFENSRDLAVSGKPMAALWREDLLPFRQLLPRLPMVLISPAAYKAYDFDQPRPACLSALVVSGLLRAKLDYRGLALAYDLESDAVRGTLDFGEAAIQSLNAGCDMLILDEGRPFEEVRRALEAGLASGKLIRRQVEHSLGRIRAAKKRLTGPPGKIKKRALEQVVRGFENFSREFGQRE
jgi:beta-N-acetylhexosaminidase